MSKMKKIVLPLVIGIFFLNFQSMFSQNAKSVVVEYQQKMVVDEAKIANFPESMKEIVRAKAKWKPAILIHNEDGSYYMLQDKMDSKTTQVNPNKKMTVKAGHKIYFNDFNTSNSYKEIHMHNEVVVVKDALSKYKWKLEPETKTIDNIKCKKANTVDGKGKKVTVWYTDQFGINNGPGDYYGLPGLVVYAEGGTYSYKLSKVNFSDKKIELQKPDDNGTQLSAEEYTNRYVNSKANESKEGNRTTTRRSVKN